VDDVVWAGVEVQVLVDLGALGVVDSVLTLGPSLVHLLEEPLHGNGLELVDWWHEGVKEHSRDQSSSNNRVPLWRVVSELTTEELSHTKSERHLVQVSVDEQKKDTSVEEESIEHTVGDLGHQLGVGVVSDPSNELNGDHLKDQVDYDNDNHNRVGGDESPEL